MPRLWNEEQRETVLSEAEVEADPIQVDPSADVPAPKSEPGQLVGAIYHHDGTPVSGGTIGFYSGKFKMWTSIQSYRVAADGVYYTGDLYLPPEAYQSSFDIPLSGGQVTAIYKPGFQSMWEVLENSFEPGPVSVHGGTVLTQDFILRQGHTVTGAFITDFGYEPDENCPLSIALWAGPAFDRLMAVGETTTWGSANTRRMKRGPRFDGDDPGRVESGEFTFRNLPEGPYLLRVRCGRSGTRPLYIARAFEIRNGDLVLAPETVTIDDFGTQDPSPIPRAAIH